MGEEPQRRQVVVYQRSDRVGEPELTQSLDILRSKGFTLRYEPCPALFEQSGAAPVLRFVGGVTVFGVSNIRDYLASFQQTQATA